MNLKALPTRYPSFVLTGITAGAFVAVVCFLMLVNFLARAPDPAETPAFLALRAKLLDEPENGALRQQIRDMDLQVRDEYFRRRSFSELGTYLLLGGLATVLIATKSASVLRRKLPAPIAPSAIEETEERNVQFSFWSVVGLLGLLVIGAAILIKAYPSDLSKDVLAVATGGAGSKPVGASPASQATPDEVAPTQPAAMATAEELQKQWPQFRGYQGSGTSSSGSLPVAFDATTGEGIRWKAEVPLPGNNSPICWGDKVFLSGATEDRREVYCFDAGTGDLQWSREMPKSGFPAPKVNEDTGYAAPTMATDGMYVFASFANGDLAAFDFKGKQVWSRAFGIPKNAYGHAASLVAARGLLFVQMDQAGEKDGLSKMYALHPTHGETVWEVARDVPNSWSSPIVIEREGTPLLIACGWPWVIAYEPTTGKEIWRCKALSQDVGPSPIYANGLVYVANEYPGVTAIRPDGQGDVTDSHTVWFSDWGTPDTCSPLAVKDMLLVLTSYGGLTSFDAVEGGEDPLWEEEIDDDFRSSPGLAGEHVYLFSESGKVWVLRVTREECTRVHESNLGEPCVTSPAFHDGHIFIRGEEHLFCIGDG